MDDTKLVPITHENLDQLMAIAAEHRMPRSRRWHERLLFSSFQENESEKCRGYLVQSELDGIVGCLCLAPIEGWFKQGRKTFFRVATLACRKKYGVHALEMIGAVANRTSGNLTFTNSLANKVALSCWKFAHFKEGPEICQYEFSRNVSVLSEVLSSPYFCSRPRKTKLARLLLLPVDYLGRKVLSILYRPACRSLKDFTCPEFAKFWDSCLSRNDGIMTSRDPKIMSELFDDSLHAGMMKLFAKYSGPDIVGYILLRKARCRMRWYSNYRIADLCAIGNDTDVLAELVEAAVAYCASRPCMNLSYIGGNKTAVAVVSKFLPQREELGRQTFVYNVADKEMQDSLAKNDGWFFGPYDGDHCLGYNGYVDL